jgi:hypothetical protein
VNVSILEDMAPLDFGTPFDELNELRAVLTAQQIADLTGLRRETISRARPDSRFQRRTEKALADLYLVVTKLRSARGGDPGQLASVLERPQEELGGRSIADLLREGRVVVVLEHLSPSEPSELEQLENLQFDPELLAQLSPTPHDVRPDEVQLAAEARRVASVLDEDPELAALLPAIEAKVGFHFGPEATIERAVIADYDTPDGPDELYLRIRSPLDYDDQFDLLAQLLRDEADLLEPVRTRLTIGML